MTDSLEAASGGSGGEGVANLMPWDVANHLLLHFCTIPSRSTRHRCLQSQEDCLCLCVCVSYQAVQTQVVPLLHALLYLV